MMKDSTSLNQNNLEIAGVFTRNAPAYDTIGTPFFSFFGEKMVDLVEIREGCSILDIACGKGASLIPAAQKTGPTGRVVGIDLSEGMIADLAAAIDAKNLKQVQLLQADAETLDFPDETFDVVLCGFSLPLFTRWESVLAETGRVLKKNGTFALSNWNDQYELPWRNQLFSKYVRLSREKNPELAQPIPRPGILKILSRLLPGMRKPQKPQRPPFGTGQSIQRLLSDAGFLNVTLHEEKLECVYRDEDEWFERLWAQGSRQPLEKITPEYLESFKKEAFEQLQQYKKEENIVITMSAYIALAAKG